MKLHILIFLLGYTCCKAQDIRGVIINEVMQSNIDCIMVDGDFPDSWVELFNTNSQDANIGGYSISEKKDCNKGYKLPQNTIIRAKEHLLIYCDKENNGLHTNFRIDAGKANLYLFNNNGEVVDSLNMKAMPAPNVAYGRTIDGSDVWHYELKPTPGSSNTGGGTDIVLPNPVFSISGGVYTKSQNVTISIPKDVELPEGTRLYITVDGSEPTEKSRSVTTEQTLIAIQSTILRAKLIAPGAISPRSVTQSFIIRTKSTKLPVVSIVSDNDYFYSTDKGILSSHVEDGIPNYMHKWRRPINIEYFNTESDTTVFNQLAETAVSGVSTREFAQKSLKVYTNNRFGKKNFTGQLWEDKDKVRKVKSFVLRNGGNNCFQSRVNDALVQKLFGTNIDNLDWQAYQPVIVYLNGLYMGEYGMRERSDNNYVESNYGGIEDIEIADESSYQNPIHGSLFESFSNDYIHKDVSYEQIANQIDIDNFLKSLIVEIYGMNTDYPTNNVSMWRPVSDDGKWRWILKDIDRFGDISVLYPESFDMISYMFNPNMFQYGGLRHFDLYKKMINFPEFRDMFIDHMTVYLGDFLKPELVLNLLEKMDNEIIDELRDTFTAYSMNFNTFTSSNRNLKLIIQTRPEHLYSQLASFFDIGYKVPTKVKSDGLKIKINDLYLQDNDFDGSFFTGKKVRLNTCSKNHGWKLLIYHQNGTIEEHVFSQPEIIVLLSDYQQNIYETLRADFLPVDITETSIDRHNNREEDDGQTYRTDGIECHSTNLFDTKISITKRKKRISR